MPISASWLVPRWPAPQRVRAVSTTRIQGASLAPYASFNLSDTVADDPQHVAANRIRLRNALALPNDPIWLSQHHGNTVVEAVDVNRGARADASVARAQGQVCAVMTADCVPVLLCADDGTEVAAVHSGWRGVREGVVAAALESMHTAPERVLAWIGPAISGLAYEVGDDVRDALMPVVSGSTHCFTRSPRGRWLADMQDLVRRQLQSNGVQRVWHEAACTHREENRFFSYRRDGVTGRMATLIWLVS